MSILTPVRISLGKEEKQIYFGALIASHVIILDFSPEIKTE